MGFFDKIKSAIGGSGAEEKGLIKVTEEDHKNAIIKERSDLCKKISDIPEDEIVKRDGKMDINFKGWQIFSRPKTTSSCVSA